MASLKSRVSLLSSQRMLDRVVYLSLSKDQVRLKYNAWIMVMVPVPFLMYLKNQVCSLFEPVTSIDNFSFNSSQVLSTLLSLISSF